MEKQLPVGYIPLKYDSLNVGNRFGPIEFLVKQQSHDKTISLIVESDETKTKFDSPYLLPSEMWCWARVVSKEYGRLNEVVVSSANWFVIGKALPNQILTGESEVIRKEIKAGLPFAFMKSITKDKEGRVLLESIDKLLLLHNVSSKFYVENGGREPPLIKNYCYEACRRVYFRYNWNPELWKNNIHTDDYARRFGYESGLPEFIMYMDWLSLIKLKLQGEKLYEGTRIKTKKILPIYEKEFIRILTEENDQRYITRFLRNGKERVLAEISK